MKNIVTVKSKNGVNFNSYNQLSNYLSSKPFLYNRPNRCEVFTINGREVLIEFETGDYYGLHVYSLERGRRGYVGSLDSSKDNLFFNMNGFNDIRSTLLADLKVSYKLRNLEELTLDRAKELKGKRIQAMYFGYAGQDDTFDFVVGDIKEVREDVLMVHNQNGENMHFFLNKNFDEIFCCSDSDRHVYFREVG